MQNTHFVTTSGTPLVQHGFCPHQRINRNRGCPDCPARTRHLVKEGDMTMYSVVLATMLTAGSATPAWHHHGFHGCHGCWGCHCSCYCGGGCYSCGCWGCHGCHRSYGCHGCYGGCSCYGCYSSCYS